MNIRCSRKLCKVISFYVKNEPVTLQLHVPWWIENRRHARFLPVKAGSGHSLAIPEFAIADLAYNQLWVVWILRCFTTVWPYAHISGQLTSKCRGKPAGCRP